MFNFFKRKTKKQSTSCGDITAPNTSIAYDAELIGSLIDDHQSLLMHYMHVEKKAKEQRFREVGTELARFKNLFHQHIMLENVKLYVYLNRTISNESENCETVKAMRRDMRHIGKAVNQFIERYNVWPWSDVMEKDFLPELQQIGIALVERIKTEEEHLYPLYNPPVQEE
ncbi:MAG: hemerythrin domain-containing protein [Sedimenticola sp.]|uniref:Hemerythrin domain-containing protein n=1 Tax=Sedimenticola thiotaurini TaxID=1543721 RepID=A0A558CMR6_9GAMM|nr:hemerythrin domain-containing protein [Sedimenticola sp.]MCW8947477.1 hemerythrin domain-containing protein [Sedimenticola sp.]MCW8949446.1 hemerythrin domain-containing protein [Sedimenticola sp.]MCW8974327.1 hemerythrin domain-containing protein [Sedimenticola sp.]TVT50067.1 MAG: hemerythrin domain-containing protein [Sedimenticola thiotaurini]